MKRTIWAICAVLIVAIAFSPIATAKKAIAPAIAQQMQRVCFKIVDDTGEPIIGASVIVKGTPRGAMADMDGNVCIDLKPGDVLVISYIGYKSQEIKYEGANINIIKDIYIL